MNLNQMRKNDLVEAILDIVYHANEMTTSDLQAVVEALADRLLNKTEE